MRRIVLQCKGRLANQLLCYANAVHVLGELGIKDSVIVLNYELPPDTVKLPGAQVFPVDVAGLPKVTREELTKDTGDVLWVWEDIYAKFPGDARMAEIIRTIEVSDKMNSSINEVLNPEHVWAGMHVRYGDFEKWNGDGQRPAFPRASQEYYLKEWAKLRDISHHWLFLASDGEDSELEFIAKHKFVVRGQRDNPIFDLVALSRCCVIIGSNSTFSSVASYLGGVPLVTP